ncbi:MAG TPA: aminotransferase class I/II-fold pyridoxal phosphate-dependent enzyme [Thermodesulfobacteriota bacterium]|nr:aminotransferase class I/II-fold pyridoxal phosphate-dependent enzyme [Thermodesulfobacteriota bacterium]
MNPLALELNEVLQKQNSKIYQVLSRLGKNLYFPKGILSQTADAQKKANKYNVTIGIATEGTVPMYLPCIQKIIKEIPPQESYPYAPGAGKLQLREKWQKKLLADNPSMQGKKFTLPIVTSGLTHGLELAADLFVDPGDVIILPDKFWENYSLIFETRKEAKIHTYPLFTSQGKFNAEGLNKMITELGSDRDKLVVLFNFPNNPTGYSISQPEGEEIVEVILTAAKKGIKVVVIMDDAYFGLFYYQNTMKESLFGHFVNLHPNIIAVKLDGPTKEQYVWGFRIGFITFGVGGDGSFADVYNALEKKTMGAIRSSISNCSHLAQSIVCKALDSPTYGEEKAEKLEILKKRALKVQEVLKKKEFKRLWEVYPFNSGYFMCLKLKNVEAEPLRVHLLDRYGVGTIAMDKWDLRITFSSIEEEHIEDLFTIIAQGVKDLENNR